MEWLEANAGWLWFVVAVVLAGVELLTLDLVLVMLAAGAAAAAVADEVEVAGEHRHRDVVDRRHRRRYRPHGNQRRSPRDLG